VKFEVLDQINEIEVIAVGTSIRNLAYLEKTYGSGRWRKLKGKARVMLPNGNIRWVELHWYEAHGIGRKDIGCRSFETTPQPSCFRPQLHSERSGYVGALVADGISSRHPNHRWSAKSEVG